MKLICILAALGFLQFWSGKNPFHKDSILEKWSNWVDKKMASSTRGRRALALYLAVPIVLLALLITFLPNVPFIIVSLLVLLFSLGRGTFAPHLEAFAAASAEGEWADAVTSVASTGIPTDDLQENDWLNLNQRVLEEAAYQGFERLFAVVFWFVFFGPVGALFYRLAFFRSGHEPNPYTQKLVWALEWPAVRVLSASFAVTGNFVGCVNRWKAYAIDVSAASSVVLRETVLGALSIDDELVQSCDCTHREIRALKKLYTRTLWFWVAVIALFTILY